MLKAEDLEPMYKPHPCSECPFRKDTLKGWLQDGIHEKLAQSTFVCHKDLDRQCAGHMLLKGEGNLFVRLAKSFNIPLTLTGRDLIFDTYKQCEDHHLAR